MPPALDLPRESSWTRYPVQDEDLDFLSNLLIEREAPLTTAELSALNKRYGIDAVDADVLAAEWLAANGF